MEIGKAVVLAGTCSGSAPWPSVGFAARQLAPVANRPVLFHHLDALAGAGIRQAAIVTDAITRASIREAVGDGSDWGLELSHVEHAGTVEALACSQLAEFAGSDPVLVHHGDVLLQERLSVLARDLAERALDALILQPGTGAVPPGYLIGPGMFGSLRREPAALDAVLARMRAAGARIGVREVDACLPCRGGAEELLEANRRMLQQLQPEPQGERVFESQIQGPVSLHPSAEIRESIVRGPVAIGPGARIANAYVGPYTSIGAGARLDCVEIEHSIVLDNAELRFLASRIEGSLIGPGASVSRDFRFPRALRLFIGEGANVALAL
jgi:glucose-1-phosphate thymidylyltransferase